MAPQRVAFGAPIVDFFFFLNITLFLIIFSEEEGTIDNQSRTSHTYTMITNQSKFKFATIYKDLDATKAE